ncbi:hypothetical protein PHMEG_0003266 [Phytophthora megakarya]|uniref:PH domain-containing protein n=1 Tax=Phytophthora megakarya TaxID=4795 RepID=A0A225WWN4_9STRA|nr:hypothetical protein PHMEG_0003266 [Phytophthora megakarya]
MAEDAVGQLLCVHLGLLDDAELGDDAVRDFRDLYRLPLRSFADKCALMRSAEATGCSAVILDVLLFVSETMAPALFRKQLAALPQSLSQWVHYLLEQCLVTNETVSLSALRGLLDLYAATQRYRELAAMLLSLVFYDRELDRTLKVTDDVLDIAKFYRHRLPVWILDLLHEYVTLSKLQLETEKEDVNTAPEICMMEANLDKRSRGVGNLQANWRMRYVKLTEREIVYFKHDEGKLEKSKNPFHDKTGKNNKKGSLALARGMQIEPLDYRGKFSLRPYCVKICDAAGNEELILDAFSPEVQRQWVAAITANGMVDASAIGYGAILDIAEQRNAPPNLLMVLEALHEKNDSKRGSSGWTCRRDVDASDAASMKITIAIPESVRADTNWE